MNTVAAVASARNSRAACAPARGTLLPGRSTTTTGRRRRPTQASSGVTAIACRVRDRAGRAAFRRATATLERGHGPSTPVTRGVILANRRTGAAPVRIFHRAARRPAPQHVSGQRRRPRAGSAVHASARHGEPARLAFRPPSHACRLRPTRRPPWPDTGRPCAPPLPHPHQCDRHPRPGRAFLAIRLLCARNNGDASRPAPADTRLPARHRARRSSKPHLTRTYHATPIPSRVPPVL